MTVAGAGRAVRPDQPASPSVRSRTIWRPWPLTVVVAMAIAVIGTGWFVAGELLRGQDGSVLQIIDHERGEVVFERSVDEGELFRLEHVHSVTGRPVVETFSVHDPSTIALEELWFDEFGPNLPAGPERIGDRVTTMIREGGAYRVLHHGRPIGTVPIRVGAETVDHTLLFADGQRLRLLDLAAAGAYVELSVTLERAGRE